LPISSAAFTGTAVGPVVTLDPAPGREAEVERALLGPGPHRECWRKGELPARLAFGSHRRIPAIVCLVETGWYVGVRARAPDPSRIRGGAHGYDNDEPQMRALFIAQGPDIARGVTLPDMDSVDVQPLLARLLGLTAPAGDGRREDTDAAVLR